MQGHNCQQYKLTVSTENIVGGMSRNNTNELYEQPVRSLTTDKALQVPCLELTLICGKRALHTPATSFLNFLPQGAVNFSKVVRRIAVVPPVLVEQNCQETIDRSFQKRFLCRWKRPFWHGYPDAQQHRLNEVTWASTNQSTRYARVTRIISHRITQKTSLRHIIFWHMWRNSFPKVFGDFTTSVMERIRT